MFDPPLQVTMTEGFPSVVHKSPTARVDRWRTRTKISHHGSWIALLVPSPEGGEEDLSRRKGSPSPPGKASPMDASRPGREARASRPPRMSDLVSSRVRSLRSEEVAPSAASPASVFAPIGHGSSRHRDLASGAADDPAIDSRDSDSWSRDLAIRPLRGGPLRDLLDAEFVRCHRFEAVSSFFGDLRSLLRKAVVRQDEAADLEQFQPDSTDLSPPGRR